MGDTQKEEKQKSDGGANDFWRSYYEAYEAHNSLMKNQAFLTGLGVVFIIALTAPYFLFHYFSFMPASIITLMLYLSGVFNERRKKRKYEATD